MLASAQLRNKVSYFKLCPQESPGVTSNYPQSALGSMVGVGGKHGRVSLCVSFDLLRPCWLLCTGFTPCPITNRLRRVT